MTNCVKVPQAVEYNNGIKLLEMCPHGQHNGFTD